MYRMVPYSGLDYEHTNPSNSPPLKYLQSIVWDDIKDELLRLDKSLRPIDTVSYQSTLQFPHTD